MRADDTSNRLPRATPATTSLGGDSRRAVDRQPSSTPRPPTASTGFAAACDHSGATESGRNTTLDEVAPTIAIRKALRSGLITADNDASIEHYPSVIIVGNG